MENILDIVEQFLNLSDEKLEELAQKKSFVTIAGRRGKKRMRKFLVILLLPIFF